MKKVKVIFLAATLCAGVAAQAEAQAVLRYTGGSLPTTQGWSEWRLDSSINPIAAPVAVDTTGGVLKLAATGGDTSFSQLGWYRRNPGLDLNKGYTIELKAKLNVAKKGSFNIQGYDNSGKGFRVTIADTFVTNQSDPLKATTSVASQLTADGQFHVYRLVANNTGTMDVYRDGAKIGSFPLSTFRFDNIIENGGFEDEGFPDFLSNGTLTRIARANNDSSKVYEGGYALEANNNGKVTTYPYDAATVEAFRTRPLAVKPNTDYEISVTRRRTKAEPWAWRDLGAFYNDQIGTFFGTGDMRNSNITWGSAYEPMWTTHPNNFTTPEDKQSVRFEFPTWVRETTRKDVISSFDNVILRERVGFGFNQTVPGGFKGSTFPEGYVNLITNGDFEDSTLNNDGTDFTWALSNEDTKNEPTCINPLWGDNAPVRIQRNDKPDDFNNVPDQWAHSGTSSLRFSSLENKDKKMDFTKELEAGKTYRFNFWHRSPGWPDAGWLKVRLGADSVIWERKLSGDYNYWSNLDLVFTATEANKTLHLYTDAYNGNWFNVYLDDLVLYEVTGAAAGAADPQIAGKTNLIANGDFENAAIDNAGNSYAWALASGDQKNAGDNFPVAWSDTWGTYVRLQDVQKGDDTGLDWAHSGSKSLRFSYLGEIKPAQAFAGLPSDEPEVTLPKAYRLNLNFEKELEANKTYTFVFWLKAANYPDKGWINVANGDVALWREELSNKNVNWTRHSITFSATEANHSLRIFTEFGGWFNLYLDDLFLYEEATYVPYEREDSYLFFGKSQNTANADVEVEYVTLLPGGAHAPGADKTVSVTYHYALSETSDTTVTAEYDVTLASVTLPTPEREYYVFEGWYSNAAFSGNAVDTISQGTTAAQEYYGKWVLENTEFSITYNENGGDAIPDSSYTYSGSAVTLPDVAKYGYDFAGWYSNESLQGNAVTEVPAGSLGNKVFWAKWTATPYSITCHANGIAGIADTTITYTIEESVDFPLTVTGYTVSWYGNEELTGDPVTGVAAGSTGDKEFWAKKEAVSYRIIYNLNFGSFSGTVDTVYTIESSDVVLPTPSRPDNTFDGWYTSGSFTGEAVTNIPAGSTGDKTFYAKWSNSDGSTAVGALASSALRIYPNPVAGGQLTIANLSGSGKVEVYSVSGALVAAYRVTGDQAVIDISALPAGTYIVKAGGKFAKVLKE
jgi:uncharacterized repeat protein (TIGR02543 family)